MTDVLRQLLSSKKATASIAGVVVALLARVGLDVELELVLGILAIVGIYVGAQGVADHGKEAKKLEGER